MPLFHHDVYAALGESNEYKRILVIEGATHALEAKKRMKKQSYKKVRIKKIIIHELFNHNDEKLIYPQETKQYIKKRIIREKEMLNDIENEKWVEASWRVIKDLEKFLESLGDYSEMA